MADDNSGSRNQWLLFPFFSDFLLLTKFAVQCPNWDADGHSAGEEITFL